ncbi:MAG TPA: hypothetical protein VFR81_16620 [Longimicrobium sp.]|nr:hypothetical protein [Longimicrobium sp.]
MLNEHDDLVVAGRDQEAMATLARHLANNYFDVTFGHPPPGDVQEFYKRVFKDGRARYYPDEPRVRNILVVGAGVSFAAFGGEQCPLAVPAIHKLKEEMGVDLLQRALRAPDRNTHGAPDRFTEEEMLIRQLHGISDPSADFESQLTILSKFYAPRQIRAAVGRLYHNRHHPHIIFETIAHLLKHRFIDIVVNYNFDEMLDQAIDEELRGGDSHFVLSDGDCERFSRLMVADQLKVPVYIKPHGTASHKSSLRFTKDAYVGMPSDLLEFTRRLLLGHTREDSEAQPYVHVNLISMGFAFNSLELVDMLEGHDRLSVFHINTPELEKSPAFQQQARKLHANTRHYFINVSPPPADAGRGADGAGGMSTLQEVLESLFETVSGLFDHRYRPRHLTRHQIVHDLLFAPGPPPGTRHDPADWPPGAGQRVPQKQDQLYFQARLLIELTLALAKGRGRLDLSGLVGDRVGTYFRLWREAGGKSSLRKVCEDLGLTKDDGFAGNVYAVAESALAAGSPAPATGWARDEPESGRVARHWPLASVLWRNLAAALRQISGDPLRGQMARLREERMIERLARLAESDAHELTPRFEADTMLLLNNPAPDRVIPTALGLTTRLESLLRRPWHLALTITERGKILPTIRAHAGGHQGTGRVNVVVAQPLDREELDKHLDEHADILIGERYELPYWAHNEHMFIVLRREVEEGEFEPLGAVSYRKRGLEHRVTPVYVKDDNDLELLVMTYFGYVVKAEGVRTGGVPDVGFKTAMAKKDELYGLWWEEMRRK